MFKSMFAAFVCLCAHGAGAATLTEQETRWLQAAAPVLAYSQQLKLPIDIVVQPVAGPNDVPIAMGFDGQRCKLVLSMRGKGDADAILADAAPEQRALMIEAMVAHEVGHCWRYAHGVWHALPAGFIDGAAGRAPEEARLAALVREMREMRREEGFSDLVALAWTARRHPRHYQAVRDWLAGLRQAQPVPRGGHDTLAWVALAADPAVFAFGATPFDAVDGVWLAGLRQDD
jgi:ADP-ribose pyrophosphatase YjhB (NUDIX family)